MNTKQIERLLEKFYEGNTSLEEERLLKEYFMGCNVPDQLKPHQPLFVTAYVDHSVTLDNPDFGDTILFQQDDATVQQPAPVKSLVQRKMMLAISLAASILLLAGLFFTFQHNYSDKNKSPLAMAEQEKIYTDATTALLLVSSNLNTGLDQVGRLSMMDKAFQNMQQFNKFYQVQTLIINQDLISNTSIKTK